MTPSAPAQRQAVASTPVVAAWQAYQEHDRDCPDHRCAEHLRLDGEHARAVRGAR